MNRIVIAASRRLSPLRAIRAFLSRNKTKGEYVLWLERLYCIAPNQKSLPAITFLILCLVSTTLADDFKTMDGKEYKNATVTRVEPDGIVVKTKSGISKVYFPELPKDVQQRFNYDPQQAVAYSAQQAANYAAYQKQEEEAQRHPQNTVLQNNPMLGQQQPGQDSDPALQGIGSRPTPKPTPLPKTTVLHVIPQRQAPRPTPAPAVPVHHPPPSHPKNEGKKTHK